MCLVSLAQLQYAPVPSLKLEPNGPNFTGRMALDICLNPCYRRVRRCPGVRIKVLAPAYFQTKHTLTSTLNPRVALRLPLPLDNVHTLFYTKYMVKGIVRVGLGGQAVLTLYRVKAILSETERISIVPSYAQAYKRNKYARLVSDGLTNVDKVSSGLLVRPSRATWP